jgi:hypothetical protein
LSALILHEFCLLFSYLFEIVGREENLHAIPDFLFV